MPAAVAEIKRGRKFDQVLAGAREVFLRDGFDGASMDEIARVAGVSKATLYSYFADKRLLFQEVARLECNRQAAEAQAVIGTDAPPEVALPQIARRVVDFVLSDFGFDIYRISVAESDRFPELGRRFYDSGPALLRALLNDYFTAAIARGELTIDDIDLAADQFAELCKADLFPRRICGVGSRPNEAEITRVVNGAVAMFLARYATRAQARGGSGRLASL